MVSISVKVKKRIFYSPDSGFGVFSVQPPEAAMPRTIVGSLPDVHEGDSLQVEGEEVAHPRFGRQIRVERYTLIPPQDDEGIIRFLSSGRIKGIGKKTAARIVAAFGVRTLEVLEHEPDRLQRVPGIRKAVAEGVKRAFQESRIIRELAVKLSPYGLGLGTVHKIYQELGEMAMALITANPYLLQDRVRGISFKTADRIGRALGVSPDDPNRIEAGILFTLEQAETGQGDLYLPEAELQAKTSFLLGTGREKIAPRLEALVASGRLVAESQPDRVCALAQNALYEKLAAQRLVEILRRPPGRREVVVHFERVFSRLQVELTEEQKEAVVSAVGQKVVVITGGPGTGKTTIIRALISIFRDSGLEVAVAAPTGRAAKRIEESSLTPASTIHRLLKINPATGRFTHDRANPLPVEAVIVDEFSMVDIHLFFSLLQAIPDTGRLIIIGDRDQLPSVGPGNVLRDIIASGRFTTIPLTTNFRQSQGGLIVENAYRVISGQRPIYPPYAEEHDFVLVTVSEPAAALQKVESIVRYYGSDYPFNSDQLQILVPMYRGDAGIDAINRLVQEKFNPGPTVLRREAESFRENDKVMQVKNDYQKEVFNGDLGRVVGYSAERRVLTASFDGRLVEYAADELDEIGLAYAVSVHKSQGSEYDVVVLVLLPGHSLMLSRELLYTAITRARKRLILLSDEETVWRACQNARPQRRRTLLPRRLEELFTPPAVGPAD